MPTGSLNNWQGFRAGLADASATPLGDGASNFSASGSAVLISERALPAGYIDLTDTLSRLGIVSSPALRVGVREGSEAAQQVINALFDLPHDVPLSRHIIEGDNHHAFHAALTLMRHGVVSEDRLAQEASHLFGKPDQPASTLLTHTLAATGSSTTRSASSPTLLTRFQRVFEAGLLPNREDPQGFTAAHHAAAAGNLETLQVLQAMRVNLQNANSAGVPPIELARARGQYAAVEFLANDLSNSRAAASDPYSSLAHGLADPAVIINTRNENGQTLLHRLLACSAQDASTTAFQRAIAAVIGAGGDLGCADHQRRSASDIAFERSAAHLIAIEPHLDDAARLHYLGHALVDRADDRILALFLPASDALKHDFIIRAAGNRMLSLSHLVTLTGTLNHLDPAGNTPADTLATRIHNTAITQTQRATVSEEFSAVFRMLARGATLSDASRAKLVDAALLIESWQGHANEHSLLRQLEQKGLLTQPSTHVQDFAKGIIDALRTPSASPGLNNFHYRQAAHLIRAGARPDDADLAEMKAQARQRGDADLLARLESLTAPRGRQTARDFALSVAAGAGDLAAVRQHLANGANPTQRNEFGQCALHIAADNGHASIVRALIEAAGAAIVNLADSRGQTPLHHAITKNASDAVWALCAAGADFEIANRARQSALDIARDQPDGAMLDILQASRLGLNALPESMAQVRRKYLQLSMQYHPDKQSGRSENEKALAENISRQVNNARDYWAARFGA